MTLTVREYNEFSKNGLYRIDMELWKKWIPLGNIPSVLYAKSIVASETGLIITFADESNKKEIIFIFNGTLYAYRFTTEGAFLKTLDYLYKHYKTEDFQASCLFTIKNSKYLKWFEEESYDVYDIKEFEHYVFYTEDGAIEVLSPYAPEIILK